jgi:4-alpha-glucanotransferase
MRFPRASGVLLHPTSLPGPHGSGDLGPGAYHFVDWLASAGQTLWQMLPLGGIGPGNSPYMSSSAFAGNVLLVDLAELQQRGWLAVDALATPPVGEPGRIDFATMVPYRMQKLAEAADAFAAGASAADRADFADFCAAQTDWLDDYTLFMALCDAHGWADWCTWGGGLAGREGAALAAARREHAPRIDFWAFCQWCFFRQWAALRAHAHARGVKIVGDAPIFIAYQSAEVWARPDLFELGLDGRPTVVAGVPPDYFSATGQRWGNPLYRWSAHADEGYAWWIQRVRRTLELVDIVRVDHFRGFADYWEVPATEPTAVKGRWRPGPGMALFDAIAEALGPLPVIAEDLGQLSQAAKDLLVNSGFPGMAILQFAFGSDASDPFLPHNHQQHSVVYTGTHDNDTTVGWFKSEPGTDSTRSLDEIQKERQAILAYLGSDGQEIQWDLMALALRSKANTTVFPLQDLLGLGTEARMNVPGTKGGNWRWRFVWDQLTPEIKQRMRSLVESTGRIHD